MNILTHPALMALGAASLCLLTLTAPLVSPEHREIYHLCGSSLSIFVPVLILLCAAWVVLTALLWLARKAGWFHNLVWTSLIVLLPWIVVKHWFSLRATEPPHWLPGLARFVPLLILIIVLSSRYPPFASLMERVQNLAAALLGFVSISSLLIVVQLMWFMWQARSLNTPLELHHPSVASIRTQKHRVIWILLDELSYQQVYERRFPGLELPAFDLLASEATVFTHAVPTAVATELAVPSLITGLPVDHIRVASDGRKLSLHDPADDHWTPFDPHQSIFAEALQDGYSTAVAGWYNPYCRILAPVLDQCFWTNHTGVAGGMVSSQTIGWNTFQFVQRHLDRLLSHISATHKLPNALVYDAQYHQMDYRELLDAGDSLLTNSSTNFIYLHMPIPHPPGIYDRQRSNLTTGSASYIDNLALADNYLAHVRRILELQDEWNSSTIVVMGDHSWRTKLIWSWSPAWTTEDQAASHGGQFDDRPVYLVKLPQQRSSCHFEPSFAAIHTRALFSGLLLDQWKTPGELTAWAAAQH